MICKVMILSFAYNKIFKSVLIAVVLEDLWKFTLKFDMIISILRFNEMVKQNEYIELMNYKIVEA